MSVKTCNRIIPILKNYVKSQNVCLSNIHRLPVNNTHKTYFSVCNNLHNRLFSTNNKKDIKQIYFGALTPQIKAVKVFSLSSSLVGIIAQPFLYTEIASTGNIPIIIAAYSAFGFFTVITPILLHFLTKKYVTHLSYNQNTDSYIAKTVNFFCVTKETEFTPKDVFVPDVPGMFTTLHVKGKPMFLDPRMFEHPDHYAKIMGYDKPMDFKLYQTSENVASNDSNKTN